MSDLDFVVPLREALLDADYRFDPVAELLGPVAQAAVARNETTPGLRATEGGSVLETLVRLWLLQAPVTVTDAEAALPGQLDRLCTAGILERSVAQVVARVDVRPYAEDGADLWIVADLTPGLDGGPQRVRPDYVLGISPAATSLAQLTVRRRVGRALDLGTGCGVQALHLARHSGSVVATDVNARALWLTAVNAALNQPSLEVTGDLEIREGSFFESVADDRFDLIVTNPPFVISPVTGPAESGVAHPPREARLVYRDSGLPGDRAVGDIVRGARAHLTDGGICQVLANWVIERGRGWQERLAQWCEGMDAWVVQRERIDPAAYVEMWLKDSGHHPTTGEITPEDYHRRYDTWLSWLEEQGVEEIGFGWINLRRTDATPHQRFEEWPYEVAQPIGPEVADHFDRVAWLRERPDLSQQLLVRRTDVVQETTGPPGAEDPAAVVLRQQAGLRRARQVSTAEAAFVGACDGDLPVGRLVAAVEQVVGSPIGDAAIRELVEEGFLAPADGAGAAQAP